MAGITLFTCLKTDLPSGVHNFDSNSFKLALCASATAPVVGNTVLANLTQVAYTNFSPASAPAVSLSESGGIITGSNTTITAGASACPAFRYYALYNDTAASKNLVAFWDHGADITLAAGETLTIKWNSNAGTSGTIFSVA